MYIFMYILQLAVKFAWHTEGRAQGSRFGFWVKKLAWHAEAFWVRGSGFRVRDLGFRVQGSGFRVQGLGFRVGDLESGV